MKGRYVKLLATFSVICVVLTISLLLYSTQAQQPKPGKEKVVEVEIGEVDDAATGEALPPRTFNRNVNINGALTVRDKVGIGTTNPGANLEVVGANGIRSFFDTDFLTIAPISQNDDYEIRWGDDPGQDDLRFYFDGYSGAKEVMRLTSDGNVGIGTTSPTQKLHVIGNVLADQYLTPSSRRWKANIQPIEGALDKVQRLRGVSYDGKAYGQHNIGLIAEEVGEVIPEVVAYEGNGQDAKSVDYARLVALLIEAVKEQQKIIDGQNSKLTEIKARLDRLESALQKLGVAE